ncbi:MAG: calcium/sodium antiporter [Bacteroidales bacterium]
MILPTLLIIIGFTSLIFGANWLINGSTSLAKKIGMSDLAVGLTVVALGTSAPELIVNILSSINGYSDIILGTVIGSNNFNLFVIIGISGIITPIAVKSNTAWKEIPLSLFIAVLFLLVANDFFISSHNTFISRIDSLILCVAFVLFLLYVFKQMKHDNSQQPKMLRTSTLKTWMLLIAGMTGLVIGGKLVVDNSIHIASELGLSEKIIGLTIIAAGTSLPELVTSVLAAIKKNSDIAIGNVIGSNIFNILLIVSVSSFINPIEFNSHFNTEILIFIAGTAFLLLAMLTGQRKKLDRWEAFILLSFFITYTTFLVIEEL